MFTELKNIVESYNLTLNMDNKSYLNWEIIKYSFDDILYIAQEIKSHHKDESNLQIMLIKIQLVNNSNFDVTVISTFDDLVDSLLSLDKSLLALNFRTSYEKYKTIDGSQLLIKCKEENIKWLIAFTVDHLDNLNDQNIEFIKRVIF